MSTHIQFAWQALMLCEDQSREGVGSSLLVSLTHELPRALSNSDGRAERVDESLNAAAAAQKHSTRQKKNPRDESKLGEFQACWPLQ